MAKMTMGFGVALLLVGVVGFAATGSNHPTALIPCGFGLALLLCGLLANSPDPGRRMLWMHVAVTLGLVGFVFPGFMVVKAYAHAHGAGVDRPAAVAEQAVMAVVCLVFTVLCVKSFIAARRTRVA
jgi:hypothetical protein